MLGATGTIGRATLRALLRQGHEVVCLVRARSGDARLPAGATVRIGDVTDPASLAADGFRGERFDALVSCLASRTGAPRDAWAIDHQAHMHALAAARNAGVRRWCCCRPSACKSRCWPSSRPSWPSSRRCQRQASRIPSCGPTAFFKSLSGQVERVKKGKPFLVFGDGTLTACKPISDDDLGDYIAGCLDDTQRHNRILPIGGPGPAITPRQQGELLFRCWAARPASSRCRWRCWTPSSACWARWGMVPALAAKAELARIGRYYATESMLVLDPAAGRYSAEATPSTGSETLFDYYAALVRGEATAERGDHAVF
jgi:divinyl chlorophyllide a 8-vinyl-reductase